MRKAMIVWGGWPGHDPDLCASMIRGWLKAEGFEVRVETATVAFLDPAINDLSLIVPIYTMSKIEKPRGAACATRSRAASASAAITAAWATRSATRSTTSSCAAASGSPIPATSSTTRST